MSSFPFSRMIISQSPGYFQIFRRLHTRPSIPSYQSFPQHHSALYLTSYRHFATKKKNQSTTNDSSVATPLPHHYTTLNLTPDASIDDIKKSHNLMIKQWHPDLYISKSPAQQQEARHKYDSIREAYSVIMDFKERGGTASSTPKGKLDIHKAHGQKHATGFTAGRRTPNGSYSYYSWGRKVYETVDEGKTDNAESDGTTNDDETEEEESESKYSETYRDNKTWMGRAMEDVYDWMCAVYMRNPSWMQFFMISAACFGIFQGLYHFLYPNVNDTDPDRIWKFRMDNGQFAGFQPSSAAAMHTTPSLGALQPHFKGHTLYESEGGSGGGKENRWKGESDDDFKNFKAENAFTMFARLNVNAGSTVNRGGGVADGKESTGRKRKRTKYVPLKEDVVDDDTAKTEESVQADNKTTVEYDDRNDAEKEKRNRKLIDNEDIPSELKSSPLGWVLASHTIQSKDFQRLRERGDFDWTPIVDEFHALTKEQKLEA